MSGGIFVTCAYDKTLFAIETERFSIRRFEPQDIGPFVEFMLDDIATRYLMFTDGQKTREGARAMFEYICNTYESVESVNAFAIVEKGSNRYLGSCGYSPYDKDILECYFGVNRPECGYGIATEAIAALLRQLPVASEVRAYCHPENYAAHSVARKAGFVSKGPAKHKHFGNATVLFVYASGNW
jgi:ribosomal-protein-alanine N-acetyltransferase